MPAYAVRSTVICDIEKSFVDKNGEISVELHPVNESLPTDGLYFYTEQGQNNQYQLICDYTPYYNGKYTVIVRKDDATTEEIIDTFETTLSGGIDYMTFTASRVSNDQIKLTKTSGNFPTLGTEEHIMVNAWTNDGAIDYYFYSGEDLTISSSGLSFTIRSNNTLRDTIQFTVYYSVMIEEIGDPMDMEIGYCSLDPQ